MPIFLPTHPMVKALRRFLRSLLASRVFLITTGVTVAVFLLMNYAVMPSYTYHGGTLAVPDIQGSRLDSATSVLIAAGLEPVMAESRPDPRIPEGHVVQQNPPAGAVVKFGRRIYLTTSGGEVLVSVPSLRGLSLRDAKFRLERVGLRPGGISYVASDAYFENTVVDQSPAFGARVSRLSAVGLVISIGKDSQQVEVPDVVGKSLTEAGKIVTAKGLVVGNVTYQPNPELLPNTVIEQFPHPGAKADPGSTVDLFVARLAAREEVPPGGER